MLRLKAISLLAAIGVTLTGVLNFAVPQAVQAGDCSSNSIIKCGVNTVEQLKQKYHQNATGDLKLIYGKFGVKSRADFNGVKNGTVYRDGRVVINGKVVATGAKTVGRSFIPGSVRLSGTNVWLRPASVSFNSSALSAFVKMHNGKFQWAVLKDCGNPVTAVPVKPEKPQPKPEKPEFACVGLDKKFVGDWKLQLTAHGKAKNAKIQSYIFHFGDGSGGKVVKTSANRATKAHQYKKAGTYTAYVIVDTNKGKTKRVNVCSVTVKLTEEETPPTPDVPTPTTPDIDIDIDNDNVNNNINNNVNNNNVNIKNVVKTPGRTGTIMQQVAATGKGELPNTGAESAALGVMGSGGLGVGIRKWLQSRKALSSALLGK